MKKKMNILKMDFFAIYFYVLLFTNVVDFH